MNSDRVLDRKRSELVGRERDGVVEVVDEVLEYEALHSLVKVVLVDGRTIHQRIRGSYVRGDLREKFCDGRHDIRKGFL